ncbi:hypothetical protein E2542_SST18214 [Spatholobus suberectus]|nr:hypothetical protein E2542_SST18214 [Spatholobus suberectus]
MTRKKNRSSSSVVQWTRELKLSCSGGDDATEHDGGRYVGGESRKRGASSDGVLWWCYAKAICPAEITR